MAENTPRGAKVRYPAAPTSRADAAMTVADRIACCRNIIRQGAMIEAALGSAFRQNSAITMLLDLYAYELEGRPAYLWQACMATTVPVSTAYRKLEMLHRAGLIDRNIVCRDHRRVLLRLTATGRNRVDSLLQAFAGLQTINAIGSGRHLERASADDPG